MNGRRGSKTAREKTRELIRNTVRERTKAPLQDEISAGEIVRDTSQDEQSQRRQKEERLWEKCLDEGKKKEARWKKKRKKKKSKEKEKEKEKRQPRLELEVVQGESRAVRGGRRGKRERREERGEGKKKEVEPGENGEMFFLLLMVQNLGVADAASDNVQNRVRKLEQFRWEKELVRNCWAPSKTEEICRNKEGKPRGHRQSKSAGKNQEHGSGRDFKS